MLVLIAYDVKTSTKEGRKRLQKVAKLCVNYGQRVQNSVFECSVDPAQLVEMKQRSSLPPARARGGYCAVLTSPPARADRTSAPRLIERSALS